MGEALTQLARMLSPTQATNIAGSLEIDGRLDMAVASLPDASHPAVRLLGEALKDTGDARLLAAVLRGYAAVASNAAEPPRAVWSGPSFDGDSDHTTAAVAHLIDEAAEDVFASTFSATVGSPFVEALWRAIARGVSVTLVLDQSDNMKPTVAKLKTKLVGAKFFAYASQGEGYAVQHSKVILVDSAIAFVTSANFSEAAAHRNLEAGLLVRNSDLASKMRQRFASLRTTGHLVPLD